MKKNILFLMVLLLFFGTSCIRKDPLGEIKRLARSSELQKKEKAAKEYKLAIDTLVKAYSSLGGLNKAIGEKLMFQKNYKNAIKHLEIARDIRNEDANIYFWLGVCYVNLYKLESEKIYLDKAEKNYKTALTLTPEQLDILYSYAHLLVYAKENYPEAIKILKKYIYDINPDKATPDPKAYFLLGRAYYLNKELDNAYKTFKEIYNYEEKLTKTEKDSVNEFLMTIQMERNGR